ncbi:hypothetical protein NMG60_11025786 [Bertholletia excelsa]
MDGISLLNPLPLYQEKEDGEVLTEKTTARKLHEAAMNGKVQALLELFHEGPHILTSMSPSSSIYDPPLHVATFLGHLDFARELLRRKPELAGNINSDGSTPLHIAAAKGYTEIVKYLLLVNPDVCLVLDREGRSPVHVAAIKGRVEILAELIRLKPESASMLTGAGESCLHLCVKYNRLEALKVLVDSVKNDDLVNWKDGEGNTVLHLAVDKKRIEIIRYLLTRTAVQVSTRNAKGFTALDVLSHSPGDLRDMDIKECLHGGGVPLAKSTTFISNTPSSNTLIGNVAKVPSTTRNKPKEVKNDNEKKGKDQQPKNHKHVDWLGRKRSALMVVASLLGTTAFQASISPPGGVWPSDYTKDSNGTLAENPHEAGKSVMAYKKPKEYAHFMICDTIAYLASFSIILIQVSGLPLRRRRWMWTQMVITWIAITAQALTYFISFLHMTPDRVEGTLFQVAKISLISWHTVMALVLGGNLVRAIRWLLIRKGYMKEKERVETIGEDDEEDYL